MKKLGILGGMGPLAGCEFYRMIIMRTPANRDQDHIDVLLSGHATLPDRTEVIEHGKKQDFLDAMRSDFKLFEAAGCDLVAIPCNTSHNFYQEISELSPIPVFNMVNYALTFLQHYSPDKKITLFATRGTYESNIYKKYAEKMQVDLVYPETHDQEAVMAAIYKVKETQMTRLPELDTLFAKYTSASDLVLLACTELSVLEVPRFYDPFVFDAMTLMSDMVIKMMRASDKKFNEYVKIYANA